jgi:hypothetical protein
MGAREVPANLVETAALDAMLAAEATLKASGATLRTVYISLLAADVPAGEDDAVSAAHGSELDGDLDRRARQVVAFLVSEAAQAGREIGLDIRVVPMGGQG